MKLALLLCGHIRTFSDSIKRNIIQIFEGYDYDIFLSTNDTLDRSTNCDKKVTEDTIIDLFKDLPLKKFVITSDLEKRSCVCGKGVAIYSSTVPHVLDRPLQDHVYNNMPMWCEDCRKQEKSETVLFQGLPNYEPSTGISSYGMWKHVWNCYNMIGEEKYDYIVRSRPDIVILEPIKFEELPSLNDNLIIGFGGTLGYPNDMFAIGTGDAMKDYCDISKMIKYSLCAHEVVGYTLVKYPIYKHIQIGIVRCFSKQERAKNEIKLGDEQYLSFYPKEKFKIK